MECACGAQIDPWREECEACELAEVMGCSEDRRFKSRGSGMASGLRSRLKSYWSHEPQFYVLRWRERGLVKIGVTKDLQNRQAELEELAGEPLDLIAHGPISRVSGETGFHAAMNGEPEKFSGEWYYWTPRLEALVERLKLAPQAA
jgi:hypothetical protein